VKAIVGIARGLEAGLGIAVAVERGEAVARSIAVLRGIVRVVYIEVRSMVVDRTNTNSQTHKGVVP
jgi:hypothetical protein